VTLKARAKRTEIAFWKQEYQHFCQWRPTEEELQAYYQEVLHWLREAGTEITGLSEIWTLPEEEQLAQLQGLLSSQSEIATVAAMLVWASKSWQGSRPEPAPGEEGRS